jgi:threonine aldolase
MHEIDRRIGLLRLLLADLRARRDQTDQAQTQLRAQMDHVVEFTITRSGTLGNALAALADLEERQSVAAATQRHLDLLRRRAQQELEALLVTRGVMDARTRLDELERRRAALLAADAANDQFTAPPVPSAELAEIDAEMAELRATIEAASDAAVRALTGARRDTPGPAGPAGATGSGR